MGNDFTGQLAQRGHTLAPNDLLRMQQEQHHHDCRNHADIHCLHKQDRLKHYGLHFCKYVGRLARGHRDEKTVERTIIDTFLVALSAANTLHLDLSKLEAHQPAVYGENDPVYSLADAAGRFADACEKIDHLEEFVDIARCANKDIILWVNNIASEYNLDLDTSLKERRQQLKGRAFYIIG